MEPVCPTYVGMNRFAPTIILCFVCMPHVCGDEPETFSCRVYGSDVCPTCVGMNRKTFYPATLQACMPHLGGDEPGAWNGCVDVLEYAPRRWG